MGIGQGYDAHRLMEGRELTLGGVVMPREKGFLEYLDVDILIHAVMDAFLGAAALGDIGQHFPDTDPAYKGMPSIELSKHVEKFLEEEGYVVENIGVIVIAQRPRLTLYYPQMAENIAAALNLPADKVSVKAAMEEGSGSIGNEEGISPQVTTLLTTVEDYCCGEKIMKSDCENCQGRCQSC